MITKAVRLYGKNDLRLESFELPQIATDEVLVEIVSDSLCMSSYKAAIQGADHKRVPEDVSSNPIIIGHEFCGRILEVGEKWANKFKTDDGFAIQPAHFYKGAQHAPGYSYPYCGGGATYAIIRMEIMEADCLLKYLPDAYFYGSLAEPMSCIINAYRGMYHTALGQSEHKMGIVESGKLALLAAVGPMGLGAIDYALHAKRRPSLLVVTDIDNARLQRAKSIFTVEHAKSQGVELVYVNTGDESDPVSKLKEISNGTGYDDVMVFAPVKPLVEQGDSILGFDGCMNLFAGPSDPSFSATTNYYNIHYAAHHIIGTAGGNTKDMREAISMMEKGELDPSVMVTHIGGLDCVAETTLNLPNIPGGKKLIYNHISMPLTAIDDFKKKGENEPFFKSLAEIVCRNNGLWCAEAEKFLLQNAKPLE